MIIVNCKYSHDVDGKEIYCCYNNYIISVEYIDNKFDEIIIKEKTKNITICYDLNDQFHNPIGPAVEKYYSDKPTKFYYFINGKKISKNDHSRL